MHYMPIFSPDKDKYMLSKPLSHRKCALHIRCSSDSYFIIPSYEYKDKSLRVWIMKL